MSYYLDAAVTCDCQDTSEETLKAMIMSMTKEERVILLKAWKIHEQYPELTPEECIKKAALRFDPQGTRGERRAESTETHRVKKGNGSPEEAGKGPVWGDWTGTGNRRYERLSDRFSS